MTLVAAVATAILVWWIVKHFAGTNPAKIAKLARMGGGAAALAAAGLLAFRGRIDMALLLGSGGAWLLGWGAMPAILGGAGGRSRMRGTASRVRSARIEMELDHDSGRISGTVLAGSFAGRALESLSDAELLGLYRDCVRDDPDGARLLEGYLDGRLPGWREDAQAGPDRRGGAEPQLGAMTHQEAYQILGLQPGAAEDAVRAAHRMLMKKLHPDQGGSTYLASRVNQAKDLLLGRHR